MKVIKYIILTQTDTGEEILSEKEIHCSETVFEANLTIARAEAYNGEYTIEDDGQPEPETQPTQEERLAELEEAFDLLLSGVTE